MFNISLSTYGMTNRFSSTLRKYMRTFGSFETSSPTSFISEVHRKAMDRNKLYGSFHEIDVPDDNTYDSVTPNDNSHLINVDDPEPPKKVHNSNFRFVDKIVIEAKGGRGGNGCIAYDILSPGKKRPSGGSGGDGGNVYVVADKSVVNLNFQNFHFHAQDGTHGKGDNMTGRRGNDVFIKVPLGTLVSEVVPDYVVDQLEDEGYDGETTKVVELNEHSQLLLLAEGGSAGIGNKAMKGTKQSRKKSLPQSKVPGEPGEIRSILLQLKLIADVGLVGYPNAGKSSLLRALSNAKPKVAAYPFTTLHPSIGVVEYSDLETITVADIPGLIEGASDNRGLGHDFLKHIERTKVLLFVVDAASTEGRKPADDLRSLIHELRKYDHRLLQKPALVFANKSDLPIEVQHMRLLRLLAKQHKLKVLVGSTETIEGITTLASELRNSLSSPLQDVNEINVKSKSTHVTPSCSNLVDKISKISKSKRFKKRKTPRDKME